MKIIDVILSPFRRWHILLSRVAKVAAADSNLQSKQASHFVCNGREDEKQINEALEHLDYLYGDWDWRKLRRRREWRLPWQPKVKITRLGEGGTVFLSEGVFNITDVMPIRNNINKPVS